MGGRIGHRLATALAIGLWLCLPIAGCTNTDAVSPASSGATPRCGVNETYSCVERIGHPVRCFCADKDTLRELLEPTIE